MNSAIFKKLLDASAFVVVLTTNTGSSFNLSAPGAFSFANPDALSNSDVSTLLLTVLSVVAIPTTLAHSFLQSSARSVVDVLEEQATGIVAEKAK